MCGITGILKYSGPTISTEEISLFNDTLTHRGPDGSGIYIDEQINLAFGHRRLSIIDLSEAGKQPMADKGGDLVITYNGEIFNYLELREELKLKGHQFHTRTDTEVILAAYKEWGQDCLMHFNGMWAFAIWSKRNKSLFISRDRFGIKPLYYVHIPDKFFAFSSESISFNKLEGFKKEIDERNLNLALRNTYYLESHGQTIYKHVNKLNAGHHMSLSGSELKIKKWWYTMDHLVAPSEKYEDQVEQFRELLIDSCRLRLRSDVPVGITLSGGLDSSSVYASIRKIYSTHLQDTSYATKEFPAAFIASFPGTTMDEKAYADEVIKYYNGSAQYIYPNEANISDAIVSEIKQEDFIYLTPPVMYNIYKDIRERGIKVSMDGHGVDEMLFGYPRMIRDWILQARGPQAINLFLLFADMRNEKGSLTKKTIVESSKVLKGYLNKKTSGNSPSDNWLLSKPAFDTSDHQTNFGDPATKIAYQNFHELSLPTILRNCDRASMRHGVEIRMPFMDWRLVTYIFSLPNSSKVKGGFTKSVLRDSMKGMLPESIRTRKYKLGINAPMIEWFNGPMSGFILDAVQSASFLQSSVWNGPLLRDIAMKLTINKKWTQRDCDNFWPYLNAWILMN